MTRNSYEFSITEHYKQKVDADFFCDSNVRVVPLPKKEFETLAEDTLIYCLQGKMKLWAYGKEVNVKKGDFLYLAYEEPIKFVSSSVDFRCDYIQISRKMAHEVTSRFPLEFRNYFITNPVLKTSAEAGEMIQTYMDGIYIRFNNSIGVNYKKAVLLNMLTALAMDIFSLIELETVNLAPMKQTREGILKSLKKELTEENVRTNRKVIFYARKLAMSPGYLNKIVQEELHTSVKTILDDMVINYIKEEVRRGDVTIKGLAIKYGFSSTAHLSSFFKKMVGVTPLEYYHSFHNATADELAKERKKVRENMKKTVKRKVGRPSKEHVTIAQEAAINDVKKKRKTGRPRKNK